DRACGASGGCGKRETRGKDRRITLHKDATTTPAIRTAILAGKGQRLRVDPTSLCVLTKGEFARWVGSHLTQHLLLQPEAVEAADGSNAGGRRLREKGPESGRAEQAGPHELSSPQYPSGHFICPRGGRFPCLRQPEGLALTWTLGWYMEPIANCSLTRGHPMSLAPTEAPPGICLLLPRSLALSTPEGAAFVRLAGRLVSSGREVTLLQAGADPAQAALSTSSGAGSSALRHVALQEPKTPWIEGHWSAAARESYLAFLWLSEREEKFALVHFPVRSGIGYFASVAKRQGLAFARTMLVAGGDPGEEELQDLAELETTFLERESALRADAVFPAAEDGLFGWLESAREPAEEALPAEPPPLVSVCLVHHDRPQLLAQALDSLRAQDYPHFEVVLADSGSERPESSLFLENLDAEFSQRGWRILRLENRGPGAARNLAAKAARGEFLLFMDDDNVARPEEIACFVRVARKTGADIVTCAQAVFKGDEPPPLGSPPDRVCIFPGPFLSVGLFRNCFGDTNALIRREVFVAVGGFSEDDGFSEDWELFIRAGLAGFRIEAIPRPLFYYRVQPRGRFRMSSPQANRRAVRRPFEKALLPGLRELVSLVQGQALRIEALEAEVRNLSEALRTPPSLPIPTKRPGALREIERTMRKARKALLRHVAGGAKPVSPRP
ncbi:glycosyltransferase family 2 protein, partial [Methylacidimicrobium tartarophylax]